jgi:hypothetical protein
VSEPDGGHSHAIVKGFVHLKGEIMANITKESICAPDEAVPDSTLRKRRLGGEREDRPGG